jgi:DNA helicase II / ATP-dependent DNA helicase PcrA
MSEEILDNLNPEQRRAVLAPDGPMLILAGAGAGKTRTLVERAGHLISRGASPTSILVITFTNKAASGIRDRIDKHIMQSSNLNRPISIEGKPFVSTFHSLGVHILRRESAILGMKKYFTIFDRDDSKRATKRAIENAGLDPKTNDPGRIHSIISKEKGRGLTIEEYRAKEDGGYFSRLIDQVWVKYDEILKKETALDFDDLLLLTRNLLRDKGEIKERYQQVWKYILIDEYQDTNRVQYEISKMLVGKKQNICVVGDIDQNIYSWRGADIQNILDFEKDYPNAEIVLLEKNYRSTRNILDAANTIIEKNQLRRKKNLTTSNKAGEKISLFQALDETDEAEFIAQRSRDFITAGLLPEEISVLYRANFQSRALEEAFLRADLPYQILGTRFFERKEVKDIISYLRLALNPDNLTDFRRIINTPKRGIGKASVAKIILTGEDSLPISIKAKVSKFRNLLAQIADISRKEKPSEMIKFIIKNTGLESEWGEDGRDESATRLENAYELANFASRYDYLSPEEGTLAFLSDVALQSDQDELNEKRSAIRLMTVHASKGLEFDLVFISGLEDGLFPHEKISDDEISPAEVEEERRLFYVALTRARKKVILSYTESRTLFGRKQINLPSEFIFDIPENLIEAEQLSDQNEEWRRKPLLNIEF